MVNVESKLVNEICNEQDFDEMLLGIIKQRKNGIQRVLQKIDENTNIEDETKRLIYEEIFKYVNEINENVKMNIKEIFICGINETVKKINNNQQKKGSLNNMKSKIKIIIADDNKGVCDLLERYLEKYNDIEILGIANTDEDEINMIESLKPEIVITDLLRKNQYTGLDIIKKYYKNEKSPEFLVISADREQDVINNGLQVAGYIKKPFTDYGIVYENLIRIKRELKHKKYLEWNEQYHNKEIVDLKKHLKNEYLKMIQNLGIDIRPKIYTEYEFEMLRMDVLAYYKDDDMDEEDLKYSKNLESTGISQEEYDNLIGKLDEIEKIYNF